MNRKDILSVIQNHTDIIWDNLCEIYPALTKYNPPIIKLNGRLYKTAGRCFQENNTVELGIKFFEHSIEYRDIMTDIILPHEIIHQADYNLFGDSEAKCGHGHNWILMMEKMGLSPKKYHNMEITR
jgi:predicted SprT family Zn-dependent metalloprotease